MKFINMNYHAPGLNIAISKIMNAIAKFIELKFDPGYFGCIEVDTRNGMRHMYSDRQYRAKIGDLPTPKMAVQYEIPPSLNTEDSGFGILPMRHYPAQGFPTGGSGYVPIYHDMNNMIVKRNDIRIRIKANFLFAFDTRGDQLNFLVNFYNLIKTYYGCMIKGINTDLLLPKDMILLMRNILLPDSFYKETKRKTISWENDTQLVFEKYLSDYSNNKFQAFFAKNIMENGEYRYTPHYYYRRDYDSIYFGADGEPEAEDGERVGDIFGEWRVNFTSFYELWIPMNYVISIPKILADRANQIFYSKTNSYFLRTKEYTEDNSHVLEKLNIERINQEKRPKYSREMVIMYQEQDLMLETEIEIFSLPEFIKGSLSIINDPKEKENAEVLIEMMKNKKKSEVENYIGIEIYCADRFLDHGVYVFIDNEWGVTIKNKVTNIEHSLFIYGNEKYIKKNFPKKIN